MNVDASFVPLAEIDHVSGLNAGEICVMLKALGEPQRFRIFTLLMAGECCVCDIEASVKLSQNLVSHHLRNLRAAGLIEYRKEGRWSYYRINKPALQAFHVAFGKWFDPQRIQNSTVRCD
jgi:DNA-binding transcriptional ArsR family regulator